MTGTCYFGNRAPKNNYLFSNVAEQDSVAKKKDYL